MPRLSVLMPAYNAEDTVGLAARSTLRALPPDAELVVLDDGSTDGTAGVLHRIDDPRLRVLARDNRGVAATLNDLLEATDSELVARMDADDVCTARRFHRQLRALSRADVLFTTVRLWTGSGRPAPSRPRGVGVAEFPFHLLLTNPVAHSTMLARREVIDAVGGYRVVPSEDYDLWLRLAGAEVRLRRLALPGLLYRTHPGQVTATHDWRLRSWRDPQIGAAFCDLALRLLGRPAQRITTLSVAHLSDADRVAQLDAFSAAFREAIQPLPLPARLRLVRLLGQREHWFHRTQTTAPAGAHARKDSFDG